MANFIGVRKKCPKNRRPGGQKNYKTKNICSIVMILVNYLDNIRAIIFHEFQALVTSMTGKVILASSKKTWFKIINEIDKWRIRDTNVTIMCA